MRRIQLVIDDREPREKILPLMVEFPVFDVEVKRLPLGDFRVDNKFLVERKTFPDLAQSLVSGRLLDQMTRMTRSHYRPILLIEGRWSEIARYKISRNAIYGAIINTSVILDIPMLRSGDLKESLWVMWRLAEQGRVASNGAVTRHGYNPKTKIKQQLRFLQGIPSIGPSKAKLLLDTFGSLQAVVNASKEELASLKGFSDKSAEKIREFLDGK